MIKRLYFLVPLVVLAAAGCSPSEAAPAPTPVPTVTQTVAAQASIPAECAQAMAAAEALLTQSSELSDTWQSYASGSMVNLLQGTATAESVLAEHKTLVAMQTAFAEAVQASAYPTLKVACLAPAGS